MPDVNGLPTQADVMVKAQQSAPLAFGQLTDADAPRVIAAVVAEFQSPPAYDGGGGTGRNLIAVTETRVFDGGGYAELYVGDIVPGTLSSVSVYNALVAGVTLRASQAGGGYNTLVMPLLLGSGYGSSFYGRFPSGLQNVQVAATWGLPVTADICEAIRCEAAYRLLIQAFVPLAGVGETVTIDGFSVNTSAGVSVWKESSPIAVLHRLYTDCVKRYRIGNAQKIKALAASRRMS